VTTPYRILDRKRRGLALSAEEIGEVVVGATDGSWSDAQLAAFLMAVATLGLSTAETGELTAAMLNSGERWDLSKEFPTLGDKHSTGGVGDKVSLILCPVLAACDIPVAMLTGRGLGHTGGTADKLEGIPGLSLDLSRERIVSLLEGPGMAVGMATGNIAPADRKLYSLRDVTGTVVSIPLITASILSKKLALGARGVVYDVKTGCGAFLEDPGDAETLARTLVETSRALGARASAMVTDMSQPLGRWVGHDAEVLETLTCLQGDGPEDLMALVEETVIEVGALVDQPTTRSAVREAVSSGRALEIFFEWAEGQGAETSWLDSPTFTLAPETSPVKAERSGVLSEVRTREIGLIVAQGGGGRIRAGDSIDHGVSFECRCRIGDAVEAGQTLGVWHHRRDDEALTRQLEKCFVVADEAEAPPLVLQRIGSAVDSGD
jgi:pyrimidine-nucleoside phosphorylase